MADIGLIFCSEMVKALLDGRKSKTRRIIKPQPEVIPVKNRAPAYPEHILRHPNHFGGTLTVEEYIKHCPYSVGDRVYVKEVWRGCPKDFFK